MSKRLHKPCAISLEQLHTFNQPAPRYTSYPTAPEWGELTPEIYGHYLDFISQKSDPLSLYIHIPFCKTMCLYCGCAVILNRKPENELKYVEYLEKEIALVASYLGTKKTVSQLHFGGGTPTKLSSPLLKRVMNCLEHFFEINFDGEIAMEIDPRTVMEDNGRKLRLLKELGFNRVSFGVQDTNEKVQKAVKRHQTYEMTKQTFIWAKELGFEGINLDLIYGLPYQTLETFTKTIELISDLKPDRISLFSYAKVPWMKPHQKAIKEKTLPCTEEKFKIYAHARARLMEKGYAAIGMDHFALEEDPMAKAYHEGRLMRNFQGYSVSHCEDLIGLGLTSIGFVGGCYIQNLKSLPSYYEALDRDILPVHRGKVLSPDDHLRKWVIHTLMCRFELNKNEFRKRFNIPFEIYFSSIKKEIQKRIQQGLLEEDEKGLYVTPLGELFVRIVAQTFDAYIEKKLAVETPKFSQSI
jgi:oxygen-independent coproporphyrinogen III oxidase